MFFCLLLFDSQFKVTVPHWKVSLCSPHSLHFRQSRILAREWCHPERACFSPQLKLSRGVSHPPPPTPAPVHAQSSSSQVILESVRLTVNSDQCRRLAGAHFRLCRQLCWIARLCRSLHSIEPGSVFSTHRKYSHPGTRLTKWKQTKHASVRL